VVTLRSPLSKPHQMKNSRGMSEVSAWWFGKTLRERRKDGKDYMNPEKKVSKGFTLIISHCEINIHHPLPLA
jgi:hypothetical protein